MKPLRRLVDAMTGVKQASLEALQEQKTQVAARSNESARQLEGALKELDAALVRVDRNVRSH